MCITNKFIRMTNKRSLKSFLSVEIKIRGTMSIIMLKMYKFFSYKKVANYIAPIFFELYHRMPKKPFSLPEKRRWNDEQNKLVFA